MSLPLAPSLHWERAELARKGFFYEFEPQRIQQGDDFVMKRRPQTPTTLPRSRHPLEVAKAKRPATRGSESYPSLRGSSRGGVSRGGGGGSLNETKSRCRRRLRSLDASVESLGARMMKTKAHLAKIDAMLERPSSVLSSRIGGELNTGEDDLPEHIRQQLGINTLTGPAMATRSALRFSKEEARSRLPNASDLIIRNDRSQTHVRRSYIGCTGALFAAADYREEQRQTRYPKVKSDVTTAGVC